MRAASRCSSFLRPPTTRPSPSLSLRAPTTAARPFTNSQRPTIRERSFKKLPIANMSTKSTQSEACCNTPAVVSKGYTPKGDYIEVDGLKTCKHFIFYHITKLLTHDCTQTPPARPQPNSASSSCTTSSASSRRPSKARTSSRTPTTRSTRSSCLTFSRESQPTSRGTRRTRTRRARS